MRHDHKTIQSLMKEPRSQLSTLIHQVAKLKYLNQQINAFLPEVLKSRCQVTSFVQGQLGFIVNSGAAATQLRYLIPDLLIALKKQPFCKDIQGIHFKVDHLSSLTPSTASKEQLAQFKPLELSETASQSMQALARSLEPGTLRDSLERLIRHAKK